MRNLYIALLLLLLAGCKEHVPEMPVSPPSIIKKDTLPPLSKDLSSAPTKFFIGDSVYYAGRSICTVKGKLIQKVFWGQPGFGEDTMVDAKWTFFVLVMDKPVTFTPSYSKGGDDTGLVIDSVQIEDQRGNPDLLASVGKHTTLRGVLNEAVLPSQCTPVTLDYQSLVK